MEFSDWTFLDRLNLSYIWLKAWGVDLLRWRALAPSSLEPQVYYGYDRIPSTDEGAFGGLVKVQDLSKHYPNQVIRPNLLYLVSSALPYFPVRMAKWAKINGARLVINQNGVAYPGWYGEGWEKANRPMAKLLGMADHVIYQSGFCKRSADRFLGQCGPGSTSILYNPVDTAVFSPSASERKSKETYLLLAGSHWSKYRVTTAVDTLMLLRKNMNAVRLRIMGRYCWREDEREARRELVEYARQKGVLEYCEILGSYTQRQAPKLLRECSVLLHTKYNDPCPRLVVEAMACGLPVVYSATGGVPELVGAEGGVGVFGPLDWEKEHAPSPAALAQAVEEILQDIEGYSKSARLRATKAFGVGDWINKHEEIFHRVLHS